MWGAVRLCERRVFCRPFPQPAQHCAPQEHTSGALHHGVFHCDHAAHSGVGPLHPALGMWGRHGTRQQQIGNAFTDGLAMVPTLGAQGCCWAAHPLCLALLPGGLAFWYITCLKA